MSDTKIPFPNTEEDSGPTGFMRTANSAPDFEATIALESEEGHRISTSSDNETGEDGLNVLEGAIAAGHEEDKWHYMAAKRDEKLATRNLTDKMKRKSYYNQAAEVDMNRGLSSTPPAIAVLAHLQYANRAESPSRSLEDVPILRNRSISSEHIEEVGKELEGVDTREILFEEIPEPLPHSKTYAKVVITEPEVSEDDFEDIDAWDSCKRLLKCLELRKKWIEAHPSAPQDVRPPLKNVNKGAPVVGVIGAGGATAGQGHDQDHDQDQGASSPRRIGMNKEPRAHPDDYRRRPVLEYDVFSEEVPDFKHQERVEAGGIDKRGNGKGEEGQRRGAQKYRYFMRRGVMICVPLDDDVNDESNAADVEGMFMEDLPDASPPHDTGKPGPLLTPTHSAGSGKPPSSHGDVASASPYSSSIMKEIVKNTRSHAARPDSSECESAFPVLTFDEFLLDFRKLRTAVHSGPVTSYSYKRLELLAAKFNLHVLLNSTRELEAQKSVPHRDFYNIRKVDTHVHHSASMSQKHLLRFIKHKLRYNPNEVVIERDGRPMTLGEVFVSLQLTAYDLSIDTLDMHAHNTFHRFDRFNLKYNPAGQSRLREIFLKTDNHIKGRYLAEMTQEVMGDLTASKYQLVEWRVSIYGRNIGEWKKLAKWFYANRLAHPNVRWMIQVPRLYYNYRKAGQIESFQELLENIFSPLFEVSLDPTSCPELHYFLETIVGIDSVDDESRPEHKSLAAGSAGLPTPDNWTQVENPPYGYWMYYTYANLCVLNKLRASRGLTTFTFRPHCGEAGDVDNLLAAFLVADGINHGILLRKNASLQYLYYLSQIGIAMSPLSNNKLFLDYHKNPFPSYFKKGLNVSLSTDDPLMLHYTKDPLLEEYSVAAQVWKMSTTDICEVARNSVLQSGWDARYKTHFLGKDLCDIRETNVPEIRIIYREETLGEELSTITRLAKQAAEEKGSSAHQK